jgi:hypothetical protein
MIMQAVPQNDIRIFRRTIRTQENQRRDGPVVENELSGRKGSRVERLRGMALSGVYASNTCRSRGAGLNKNSVAPSRNAFYSFANLRG